MVRWKKCKNVKRGAYYSGHEPSPKGLGICARGCKAYAKKIGKDGKMWCAKPVVIKTQSGRKRHIKRWVRLKPKAGKSRKIRRGRKPGPKRKSAKRGGGARRRIKRRGGYKIKRRGGAKKRKSAKRAGPAKRRRRR